MGAQLDQAGVEVDLVAAALQHGDFEIVVENHARLPAPVFKGMHMAAQEVLHGLIEEELQIQRARVRQRHHEAGQARAGAAHHDVAEVGPVDLRLLAGKRLQTQERLRGSADAGGPRRAATARRCRCSRDRESSGRCAWRAGGDVDPESGG